MFDDATVITGSHNWTVSAARHNRENIVVSTERRLVREFTRAFDELWADLADLPPRGRYARRTLPNGAICVRAWVRASGGNS